MSQVVNCYFWDSAVELENRLEFEYHDIGEGLTLKKPILDVDSLKRIILMKQRSNMRQQEIGLR